jgi:hypothetical protein
MSRAVEVSCANAPPAQPGGDITELARPLFSEIPPPAGAEQADAFATAAIWLTWSPQFRDFAARWCGDLSTREAPRMTSTTGGSRYGRTLTSRSSVDGRGDLYAELELYARVLARLEPDRRVVLFDGLLSEPIDSAALTILLAALRDALVRVHGEPEAALYAPLGSTGPDAGRFNLHADLYVPHKLMNVFEDVPTDGSGAALFLSAASLMAALAEANAPDTTIERIRALLERPLEGDRFEEFRGLLYPDTDAPWQPALARALSRRQVRRSLGRGQGYLLNDRCWLHGREAPTGGVSPKRLHRLVFR